MRRETAEKVREDHYPAPFKLIDLFDRFGGDRRQMAIAETRFFAPLMVSETSRNLRRVFRLSEMLKGEAPKNVTKPKRVHVIGAGTMGADIAAWCVISGMEVSIQDMAQEQIDKALGSAKKLFKKRLRGSTEVDTAMARLYADAKGDRIPRADVVIEAIVEKLDIKQKVLAATEARMKPGALLATNTSSLPIEQIAQGLADPGRLIGVHFFNPVPQMPLVEVVRGPGSREDVVRQGCGFVAAIDKFPLITKSTPGFLVNRVLGPYMFDAIRRIEEGTPKEKIDAAAEKFGMPMGPVELADTVGLDICANVAAVLGNPPPPNSELARLVAAGKLGKKTGSGFYTWVDGKAQKAPAEYDQAELDRLGKDLVKPLIDECEKCLAEGVVADADHVDAGVIFGTGFAPFRGGPLHYRAAQKTQPLSTQPQAGRGDGDGGSRVRRQSMAGQLRRVAVIGGIRTPFCRSNTAYSDLSNLDLMTAALNGLVEKFHLEGQLIDEVVGGAVLTHSKDFNLARESVIATKLDPRTPGVTLDPGLRNELAGRPRQRGEDRHRPDRMRDCRRLRHDVGRADRRAAPPGAASGEAVARENLRREGQHFHEGFLAIGAGAGRPERRRAAHRPVHGPAYRADGAGIRDLP